MYFIKNNDGVINIDICNDSAKFRRNVDKNCCTAKPHNSSRRYW